jgi:hypothetical protein
MTAYAAGQILCGSEGRVYARIWGELYYISPEDLGLLFFVGERVSLIRKKGPVPEQGPQVAGTVYLSPSGRAVIIAIDRQRYLLPRDKFLAVALGEDVSCIFFEAPGNEPEIETISPRKGGAAS